MAWSRFLRATVPVAAFFASTAAYAVPPEPALTHSPLALAPGEGQLASLPAFTPRWFIATSIAAQFDRALTSGGFSPELATELRARLRIDPATGEGLIVADRALLARFTPAERARWHALLGYHFGNETYRWPLSLSPTTLATLDAEPRWREAVAHLRASGLTWGERLVFGDLFALEDAFASAQDRTDFYRIALGAETLLLKLRPESGPDANARAQAAYWQVHGRFRAIEPMLNAVASIPNAPRLDVAHLLPRLPRALLNTYPPHLARAEDPGVDSSLLASDFIALTPGADQQAPGGFKAWLERACLPVEGDPQYGDLLVYGDLERTPWPYTAVYIAGGIGFARRPTAFGPWVFVELDKIPQLNPRFADRAPLRFRLRSASAAPGEPPFLPGRMPEAWRQRLQLRNVAAGPWGKLHFYDVLLAPAGDTLEKLPPPSPVPEWKFRGVTPAQLLDAIDAVAMPAATRDDLHTLFTRATPDATGTLTVHPSLDLVLATPRELRSRIFPHLVGGDSITDYAQHIPFPAGFTIDEWFDAGSLPESVRQAILRLAYPVGDRVMLSDFGALYQLLPTRPEQLSAHRAALRVPAVVVLLEKPTPAEAPAIARYWQGGRAKNIDRLLRAFAADPASPRYLDIIHLLSPIEREFLNTYFTPDGPSLTPSCFWTAFSFGEEKPDDRYLVLPGTWTNHEAQAWEELTSRFDRIDAPSQLGDIIGYRRQGVAAVEHVCVFIADGLVFTKNGPTFSKPWCLSRLSDVDELYLTSPAHERVYFRRRPPVAG